MDANDFLMAGGNPSAKFPEVGATVAGTITRVGEPMQQRDPGDNKPKVWDDGSPMLQLPVDVQTSERDPAIDNDDGIRTLYIKGNLKRAITEAVRRSGAKMLAVGGTLVVQYTADGERTNKAFNPPKLYAAAYTPPAPAAAAGFLNAPDPTTVPAAAQPAPVAGPAPVAAPAPAPATGAIDPASLPAEVAALLAQISGQQAAAV